jgi:hypothetical protein
MAHLAVIAEGLAMIGRDDNDGILTAGLGAEPLQEETKVAVGISDLAIIEIANVPEVGGREIAGITMQSCSHEPARIGEWTQVAGIEVFDVVRPPLEVVVHLIGMEQQEERPVGALGEALLDDGELVGEHRSMAGGPVPIEGGIEAEHRIEEPPTDTGEGLIASRAQRALEGDGHRDGLNGAAVGPELPEALAAQEAIR